MTANSHTLLFAALLGGICALLLTAAGKLTAPYRAANEKAEEVRNVLGVLGTPFDADASSEELVDLFEKQVRSESRGDLEFYAYTPANEEKRVAVPFSGPGLWGPIKGFLALESDLRTIRDITFHEQEETPGLGGEIAAICSCAGDENADWHSCAAKFRHQFRGKAITDEAGKAGMQILRDGATAPNHVDGITGATMTTEKVQAMLNSVIEKIVGERDAHVQ